MFQSNEALVALIESADTTFIMCYLAPGLNINLIMRTSTSLQDNLSNSWIYHTHILFHLLTGTYNNMSTPTQTFASLNVVWTQTHWTHLQAMQLLNVIRLTSSCCAVSSPCRLTYHSCATSVSAVWSVSSLVSVSVQASCSIYCMRQKGNYKQIISKPIFRLFSTPIHLIVEPPVLLCTNTSTNILYPSML